MIIDAYAAWVYRDDRAERAGVALRDDLVRLVRRAADASGAARRAAAVDALVASGTLEAGLADARHPSANALASASDAIAEVVLGAARSLTHVAASLASLDVPECVATSTPEGFAYYALHPEAYARAMREVAKDGTRGVLVVGLRSIGTTLSAIARAELASRAIATTRITVRPTGDPYDRNLAFSSEERAAVARARDAGWIVAVVDEGPGISGSTFLAAVDAVAAAGVPRERIVIVCAHAPAATRLKARDAATRWRSVRSVVVPSDVRVPEAAETVDVSGGAWRTLAYADDSSWPAVFAQCERRKLLAGDRLFKFEGLGRSGRAALARAEALASAKLAHAPRDEGDGWLSYPWLGAPLTRESVDDELLATLAAYVARRETLCPAETSPADLAPMAQKNLRVVLGGEHEPPALDVRSAAIVDGRMAPHEWVRAPDGRLLKVDGVSHGDDHFFPGPTDVLWDLAGVVVEWDLAADAAQRLCVHYRRASGEDARARLVAWVVAYAAFRAGLTALAHASTADEQERARLGHDLARYRSRAAAPRI